MAMKLQVQMTLTAETAKRLQEAGERLATMDLGEDGMLAAAVLIRIAADYEQARKAQEAWNKLGGEPHK